MTRTFLLAAVLVTAGATARAENWPSWRGPRENGISHEKNIPAEWGPAKNVAWKLPLPGPGGSTPAVWGDRHFLTYADAKEIGLLCAGTDGKERWRRKLGPVTRGDVRKGEANEASPSPSTDGKHVWAFTASGELGCFDFDGTEVWHVNMQKQFGRFQIGFGMHTTPVLHGDKLYFALLHGAGHWVVALDKSTGKEVWKVARPTDARGESKESYASPVLWRKGNEAYLVVLGADYATAHKLDDGAEIWRLGDLNPKSKYSDVFRIITSPTVADDAIIVPTCRGGLVVALDPKATGSLKVGGDYELWHKAKGCPDVPTPVVHEGLLYLCRENGVLQCWDAKTGEKVYEQSHHGGRYRASPIVVDGKVILTSRDGTFSVVKAGRAYELLATNRLPDDFVASPAVADGRLYLRGFDALYAIQADAK